MALWIVATPIGNLEDITYRAVRELKAADCIACEDTRKAAILLRRYGIKNRLISYFEHNERSRTPQLVALLLAGKNVALICSAGTPLLSDPGYVLVGAAIENGIPVTAVPGPSALLGALTVSGLPMNRFVFEGFLPKKKSARRRALTALIDEKRTAVLYESPHRIIKLLADLDEILGARRLVVVRELTKLHESVYRGTAREVGAALKNIKGEFTVVVEGTR